MKVRLFSDIHLEFGDFHPGEGDVLVLAGDICSYEWENKYDRFFKRCVEGYNKVFYTLGNHEHYGNDFSLTELNLRSYLPDGISLLNKQVEEYNGWYFVGSTLWASFYGGNEQYMDMCKRGMSDYHTVTRNEHRKLNPIDTLDEHVYTTRWLKGLMDVVDPLPIFMFTHHAPCMRSAERSHRSADLAGAYASNLEHFITTHPQIKYWAHGHIHESQDYFVGDTRIISNPRGYADHAPNLGFNPLHEIDLSSSVVL